MCMTPGATRSSVNHAGITRTRHDESLNIVLWKTQTLTHSGKEVGRWRTTNEQTRIRELRMWCDTKIAVSARRNRCEKLSVGVLPSRQPASKTGHLLVSQVTLTYTSTLAPKEVRVCGLCITGWRNGLFPHLAQAAGSDICKAPPTSWRSQNLAHQPYPTWPRHNH